MRVQNIPLELIGITFIQVILNYFESVDIRIAIWYYYVFVRFFNWLFFNWSFCGSSWTVTFIISVECCMDAFLWDINKCPWYFSAVGTQWSFSEITVAKPSFQMTFLMWFVSPIANQDILNQNWKCVSNYGQNVTFSKRYNRFTCIVRTVSNDACMSFIHMITVWSMYYKKI